MSVEQKVEPALTPEEWTAFFDGTPYEFVVKTATNYEPAAAALLLYGQPFGFTWEDVDAINASRGGVAAFAPWWAEHLGRIADRIAALLPPREAV